MATRVTLFHNPKAGFDNHSKENLVEAFRKKGFEVTYVDTKSDDYKEYLKNLGELVVVAGGDGTVGKIAKHLINSNIPIGILPLGTANNIASSLGISGEVATIIENWNLAKTKLFDIGVVNGPEGETLFFESAGFGILPKLITQHVRDKDNNHNEEDELEKALTKELDILEKAQPHTTTIKIEDQELTGKYILIEIMNIRLAGPSMEMAPDADPGDGLLDVVLVREDDREKFKSYIIDCIRGTEKPEQWQVRRTKKLQVTWTGSHYHADSDVCEGADPVTLEVSLIPKGLKFLKP